MIAPVSLLTAFIFDSTHLANDYGLSCDISYIVASFFTFPTLFSLLSSARDQLLLRDRNGVLFIVLAFSHPPQSKCTVIAWCLIVPARDGRFPKEVC